jgi:hypothetical protein
LHERGQIEDRHDGEKQVCYGKQRTERECCTCKKGKTEEEQIERSRSLFFEQPKHRDLSVMRPGKRCRVCKDADRNDERTPTEVTVDRADLIKKRSDAGSCRNTAAAWEKNGECR